MANEVLSRFFGGPPLWVVVRLILLSILVGVILSAIGLDPFNILTSIERFVRAIWDMGWDAVSWVWRYFLLGAVLVVPIWLIVRLVKAPTRRG
jgi:NADH:ubiquinone oxidoreductase subunit 5 (subunit L)/multisubunit Na+/H+ antiporter MnhA subunit